MSEKYYIVKESVLSLAILKVMQAKRLLETGKLKTVKAAVAEVGISRSVFYKYQDAIFPFYETSKGQTITISMDLDHEPGCLSNVLNLFATFDVNILTINQTIPINNIANVTITMEINKYSDDVGVMFEKISTSMGIKKMRILARE
jgi:ACT domain-containing protein